MSTVKSTVKFETCSFSECKIYAGRGVRFISRDGKTYIFLNSKCSSLFHSRVKPARLTWTQAWRRANKKLSHSESTAKRRTRRTHKIQKAIVGLSLDDLAKKRSSARKLTSATKVAMTKEDRARTLKNEKASAKKAFQITARMPVNKHQMSKNIPRIGKQTASSRR